MRKGVKEKRQKRRKGRRGINLWIGGMNPTYFLIVIAFLSKRKA
jgi:hypothetical protein